jgi:hypothetical protein
MENLEVGKLLRKFDIILALYVQTTQMFYIDMQSHGKWSVPMVHNLRASSTYTANGHCNGILQWKPLV